jgi:hypothetical protein
MLIAIVSIMGCSGNNANLRNLSESESKATQQELIDNWSDYNIRYNGKIILFDPNKDDRKIIVGNYWGTVKDQETWTRLVNGTEKLPYGHINLAWGNEIREIWVPNNQFYGYVSHQPNELISAQIVDENTVQIFHSYSTDRRNF